VNFVPALDVAAEFFLQRYDLIHDGMSRATVAKTIGTFKIFGILFAVEVVRIKLRPKQPAL